jgi:hypothetical protein
MAAIRSFTPVNDPRRILLSVISRNQRSTRFSHDELVGMKWRWIRGWAGRVSDQTSVRTTEGMADVSLLDATRCRIVGWQVASEMTVQTVLRALEVARLRRGAFHAGLSFSCDRAHSDAGSQY